ncbi:lipopolysaccharide-induced tumor necrosis factor-alpha factor homolog isoform X2 [Ischnura elegans]|uniref:lipopolysaccharide-induced tumor necrosis factor-alpha factor homolog isoform X2 n=1 Tax=Ischnura elegans TaxID=197161 RepID=UPI001ED87AA9|nr:lipopolysaccharide-induced tumor necrosis factor-alpha factor homolog isoform X2 [Ischnura elegans]
MSTDFEMRNFKRRRQKRNSGEGSSHLYMEKTGKSENKRKVEGLEDNVAPQNYGPEAQHLTCPSCRATVTTKVLHENSTKTHIICLIMCVVGLWPCCLIPYCVDSCKNANHYCPSCNAYLGTYKG